MPGADQIEFYRQGEPRHMAVVESSVVPPVGALISIRGETWEVVGVTYALDHADDMRRRKMRANVDLVAPRTEEDEDDR